MIRMDKQLFIDVYNDKVFSEKVNAMLKTIFRQNKTYFEDQAIDLDDFIQEMWCELFEEKTFMPDRAWCFDAVRSNALNYIRDIKNRDMIASFSDSYYEVDKNRIYKDTLNFNSPFEHYENSAQPNDSGVKHARL